MAHKDTPAAAGFVFDLEGGEQLVGMPEIAMAVARLRGGRVPTPSAVRGWYDGCGVRGVLLPSLLIGGKRLSSLRALHWWINACTQAQTPDGIPQRQRRRNRLTASEQKGLERHGLAEVV